ncbi:MAG: hypothetical protein K1X64_01110 [Myxococcaceae bacterium]|nr:hypothetical protein [Myxococcaceae bacterium]
MSETTATDPNSSLPSTSEERVRKVYVRDIQAGHTVHTVFRATKKQKSTSRQGKTFLAVTLADKTGELEARVFDNVETVETAFANRDYLLVKGRVITFHNKPQLVIEALDRLDPEPMDEKEFTPPAPPPETAPHTKEKEHRHDNKAFKKALRARLLTLLDDPVIFAGLEALVHHLEKFSQQRHSEGGQPPRQRGRGPRVEHKPETKVELKNDAPAKEPATERDPSLPKDLIFKSFTQLSGESEKTPS